MRTLYDLPVPTIAAVNGPAIAGGMGIATLCDFTLAVPEAKFGYTEVRIGFIPAIVSAFLRTQIGDKRSRDLLLTGRLLSAEEAQTLGLVTRIVPEPELMPEARALAARLQRNSPAAMEATKRLLGRFADRSLSDDIEAAILASVQARDTDDFREGVHAFLEKRDPQWPSLQGPTQPLLRPAAGIATFRSGLVSHQDHLRPNHHSHYHPSKWVKCPQGSFRLSPLTVAADMPLHRQVYAGFRNAILRGDLAAGQQVPSSRSLAAELEISRFPVLDAYAQLLAEGYFETRVGAGTFVSATIPTQRRPQPHRCAASPVTPRPDLAALSALPLLRAAPLEKRLGLLWGASAGAGSVPFRDLVPAGDAACQGSARQRHPPHRSSGAARLSARSSAPICAPHAPCAASPAR